MKNAFIIIHILLFNDVHFNLITFTGHRLGVNRLYFSYIIYLYSPLNLLLLLDKKMKGEYLLY